MKALWVAAMLYAYLLWRKYDAGHATRSNNVYTQILHAIQNLRPVVGGYDADRAEYLMDMYAKRPSVERRNALLNLCSSWKLRRTETEGTRDYISHLTRLVKDWTRSNLGAVDTQYDAPRAHAPAAHSAYFLYV